MALTDVDVDGELDSEISPLAEPDVDKVGEVEIKGELDELTETEFEFVSDVKPELVAHADDVTLTVTVVEDVTEANPDSDGDVDTDDVLQTDDEKVSIDVTLALFEQYILGVMVVVSETLLDIEPAEEIE